jgi:FkbM family methyltransferase
MRDVKAGIAAGLELVVGRRNLVRGARFALDYARRDLPNRLGSNGEWLVQDVALRHAGSEGMTVLDVGANVGAWTARLLSAAAARGQDLHVHAFEASPRTYGELVHRLGGQHAANVTTVNAAASNRPGRSEFFEVHELAGSNSLHGVAGETAGMTPTEVDLLTIDAYCDEAGIDHVHLMKIDTEGHDLLVIEGAGSLVAGNAIDIVQFEYNFRWIGARRFLKDAFDLLVPHGYAIGKVTPNAIEWYEGWSPELETFREANYVAVGERWLDKFNSLPWWNRRSYGSSYGV